MMILGFLGVGFMAYRRKTLIPALPDRLIVLYWRFDSRPIGRLFVFEAWKSLTEPRH